MPGDAVKGNCMHVSLQDQIVCAKRELALRQRVYPGYARMTQAQRAYELAAMQAIIETLEALSEGDERQLTLLPTS